jgi:carboxymethylenebutenolidase
LSRTEVSIPMPEGPARAFTFTPDNKGSGPWPGAVFVMDAPAIRPALFDMGQRLADLGYVVLLPDMFWRAGPYEPIDLKAAMASDEARRAAFGRLRGSTDAGRSNADMGVFIDWVLAQPQVSGSKVGLTGYCMGGAIVVRAAGTYPDKVAAAGAFHGTQLATDADDSPHLLAPGIKARIYVGAGDQDAGFPPEQAERFRQALTAAGVANTVEIYEGARHGYAPRDMPAYNEAGAERHWRELEQLFGETLKVPA